MIWPFSVRALRAHVLRTSECPSLDLPSITSTYNNINIVLNLTQDLSYLGDKSEKPLNQIHPKKQIWFYSVFVIQIYWLSVFKIYFFFHISLLNLKSSSLFALMRMYYLCHSWIQSLISHCSAVQCHMAVNKNLLALF